MKKYCFPVISKAGYSLNVETMLENFRVLTDYYNEYLSLLPKLFNDLEEYYCNASCYLCQKSLPDLTV